MSVGSDDRVGGRQSVCHRLHQEDTTAETWPSRGRREGERYISRPPFCVSNKAQTTEATASSTSSPSCTTRTRPLTDKHSRSHQSFRRDWRPECPDQAIGSVLDIGAKRLGPFRRPFSIRRSAENCCPPKLPGSRIELLDQSLCIHARRSSVLCPIGSRAKPCGSTR